MAYLRHAAAAGGLDRVSSVALVCGAAEWIRPQLQAELAELFPGLRSTASQEEADLLVVAGLEQELPTLASTLSGVAGRKGVVWLYAVDRGRLVQVRGRRGLRRWRRARSSAARTERWAAAHRLRWRLVGEAAWLVDRAVRRRQH